MRNSGPVLDDHVADLFMENSQHLNSASQLMSTSLDNLNSNSQSGFANYFSSTSFGEDGLDNNEMVSPTAASTNPTESAAALKKRKKAEKDLKGVWKLDTFDRHVRLCV